MTVYIQLTTAGTNTGPFNLFSNLDGFTTAFESGVAKSALVAGYTSALVPNGTTTIRVQSVGACTNYIDIVIGATTTTTTTNGSLTTTTTLPTTQCGEYSLEGGLSGRTFNFTNCDGNSQTVVVPAGDVTSACIQLPYSAAGATFIDPCGTATLTMTYIGGNGAEVGGVFRFNLSSALPANITISGGQINAYNGGSCITSVYTANQSGSVTITSGSLVGNTASDVNTCADRYSRYNGLTVNGNPVVDGDTLIVGGVTLIISIPTTCQVMSCVF